ncbi:MAG TPA: hypothetical protein VFS97_12990 [Nitrososphaeraceae archaeon]|nr:hypothetical protein [Nitrososphaeraceae archaeon]
MGTNNGVVDDINTAGIQLEILKTNKVVSKIMVNSNRQTFTCET